MKLAVLGDTHFGLRHDSLAFTNHQRKFYETIFFPYLREHGITDITQTGDFFDNRKHINIKAIRHMKEVFLDIIKDEGFNLITYAGNHDLFYKNTNSVYSVKELISKEEYPTVRVIQDLVEDDNGIAYIPWINSENEEEFRLWADETNCTIAFGHFEFTGFDFMKGIENKHGLSAKSVKHIPLVISGHFHHKSRKGNIFYVGSPYEMTWGDFNDEKGFHILDTVTRECEFIKNPHVLYHKIFYNDIETDYDDFDYGRYKDSYVKVFMVNKTREAMWNRFAERLFKSGLIDANIIEQPVEYSDIDIEDINIEDTTSILLRAAEEIKDVDVDSVKKILIELHTEAQQMVVD